MSVGEAARPSRWRRAGGVVRLVHPFPSLLDAAVTGFLASFAGGTSDVVARLALGMFALQFSIGAANDVADLEADAFGTAAEPAGHGRPSKPLPAGLLRPRMAIAISACLAAVGLLLSGTVGNGPLLIAVLGLGDGLLYDLRLKGTAWSWLPFAIGVGLLPLYAWWGGEGRLPVAFAWIFCLAVVAGASLAIGNAIGDLELDAAAGVRSVATRLGRARSLVVDAALLAATHVVVAVTFVLAGTPLPVVAAAVPGLLLGWVGFEVTARPVRGARQLGWELQAAGVAIVAVAWVAALLAAGLLQRAS